MTTLIAKRLTLIVALITQILFVGILPIWFVMAMMSVMAFDAGPATWAYVAVTIVWAAPLVPLGLAICVWICYKKSQFRIANILSFIMSIIFFIPVLILTGHY